MSCILLPNESRKRICEQPSGKYTRHSPHPRHRSAESIASRETELAGTGLRVKVPVEEHSEVPSVSRKADGKGGTPKTQKSEQSTIKERIQRTPQDVTNHFKELKKNEWKVDQIHPKYGKIYKNKSTGEKRWGDFLHNEIECNLNGKAWVIDPVTGRVLDKKGHLLKSN
jgi:hypothetical protein